MNDTRCDTVRLSLCPYWFCVFTTPSHSLGLLLSYWTFSPDSIRLVDSLSLSLYGFSPESERSPPLWSRFRIFTSSLSPLRTIQVQSNHSLLALCRSWSLSSHNDFGVPFSFFGRYGWFFCWFGLVLVGWFVFVSLRHSRSSPTRSALGNVLNLKPRVPNDFLKFVPHFISLLR